MYAQLAFAKPSPLQGSGTLIFPLVIRDAVRERFEEPDMGLYDSQHEASLGAENISLQQMLLFKWRQPPKHCKPCM